MSIGRLGTVVVADRKYSPEGDGCSTFLLKDASNKVGIASFKVHHAMTGNCQLFCIAYIEGIVNNIDNPADILRAIQPFVGKSLVLVDIHQYCKKKFTDLFQIGGIKMDNNYTSTNGSEMCIIVANLNYLK